MMAVDYHAQVSCEGRDCPNKGQLYPRYVMNEVTMQISMHPIGPMLLCNACAAHAREVLEGLKAAPTTGVGADAAADPSLRDSG